MTINQSKRDQSTAKVTRTTAVTSLSSDEVSFIP
jgi:hypothetical protein